MYKFTFAHLNDYNVKLYLEQSCKNNCYNIVDPENIKNLVLVHYSETKIIPPRT